MTQAEKKLVERIYRMNLQKTFDDRNIKKILIGAKDMEKYKAKGYIKIFEILKNVPVCERVNIVHYCQDHKLSFINFIKRYKNKDLKFIRKFKCYDENRFSIEVMVKYMSGNINLLYTKGV